MKALITGGVSGLGLAVARKIVAEGGQAVLLDINDDAGAAVEAELGSAVKYLRTDVTSEQGGRGEEDPKMKKPKVIKMRRRKRRRRKKFHGRRQRMNPSSQRTFP